MDLHPYDGVERRFRHTDPDRKLGNQIAARQLGLDPVLLGDNLRYDLSLYSAAGELGVLAP